VLAELLRALRSQDAGERSADGGPLVVHPDAVDWLAGLGLTSPEDFPDLPGEVVSGHPSRHVRQVVLDGRACYLKREHRVGWRERLSNWLRGAGWVSRSVREGRLLLELEQAGVSVPRFLAFGEDRQRCGFLLIEEAAGAIELRRFLTDCRPDPKSAPSVWRSRLRKCMKQGSTIRTCRPSTCW
jgi:hypothetical protein